MDALVSRVQNFVVFFSAVVPSHMIVLRFKNQPRNSIERRHYNALIRLAASYRLHRTRGIVTINVSFGKERATTCKTQGPNLHVNINERDHVKRIKIIVAQLLILALLMHVMVVSKTVLR